MFTGKLIIVQLFLLLIPFFTFSQIPKEDFKKDLERYKFLLNRYYLGYTHAIENETLDAQIVQLYNGLPDTFSLQQAYQNLAKLNTAFQDLHLSIGYPSSLKIDRFFPLEIRKLDHSFYVAYNLSADTLIRRGDKISSINGLDPLVYYMQFMSEMVSDGDRPFSKAYYAEYHFRNLFTRKFLGLDSVEIVLERDSVLSEHALQYETAKQSKKFFALRYPKALRKNVDVRMYDSVAVLDITSFSGKLKKPLKKAFKSIAKEKDLIIDLRGNGGGAIKNMTHLLRYVLHEPFELYDTVKINKPSLRKLTQHVGYLPAKWYLKKENSNTFYIVKGKTYKPYSRNHFDGNLYVLMNGGTYSAATFSIALLNNHNRATFVGSPPGGANWGSFAGIFKTFTLKHSKIRVNIPLMQLQYNSEGLSHSNFVVLPDFYVNQGFEDFIKREDSVLKFTRNLILNAHERD